MNYVFYSFYIAILLKGKVKVVQILLSGIITVLVLWTDSGGSINYMFGKSDSAIDLFFMVLLIYSLMNFGYSIFNSYDAPLTKALSVKEKAKSDSLVTKNEVDPVKIKKGSKLILQSKSYGSGIKTSPKIAEIKKVEVIKQVKPQESRKAEKEEMSPPALEINIKSTEEILEETEEPDEKYSGIINEYTTDVIDFFETPSPGTKSAF